MADRTHFRSTGRQQCHGLHRCHEWRLLRPASLAGSGGLLPILAVIGIIVVLVRLIQGRKAT